MTHEPPKELTLVTEKHVGSSLVAHDLYLNRLTIDPPPRRLTIPTPIPIVVPPSISRLFRRAPLAEQERPSIVRTVTTHVEHNEVLAILGGSGSGKTTVLHAIAGRLAGLQITEGTVRLARRDGRPVRLGKALGFVRQADYLLAWLTVRETLDCAAALRLPASTSKADRAAIVEATIVELGLSEVANVVVGGARRKGISGGEARRLTIGCVLVTRPSVIVLDEVLSALSLMR